MSTILICMVLSAMAVCSLRFYVVRLSSGCCGGAGQPYVVKVKIQDRNRLHYPYQRTMKVDGMFCGNSAVHVENALNSIEGVWAKANLLKGEVDVRMKTDLNEAILRAAVRDVGYTVHAAYSAL